MIDVSRDLDGRVTELLEIAVGDRIRIGATRREKQLLDGTVVTVDDLEVRRGEAKAVRPSGMDSEGEAKTREPEQPSRQRTRPFTHVQSHYLFPDRFGRPDKRNDTLLAAGAGHG